MQQVDFSYYYDIYCGREIDSEEVFRALLVKACAYINRITFGRAEAAETEAVKNAVCAVCEAYYKYEAREGISSENNDGYSVTYKGNSRQLSRKLYEAALLHLPSELLYRGVN